MSYGGNGEDLEELQVSEVSEVFEVYGGTSSPTVDTRVNTEDTGNLAPLAASSAVMQEGCPQCRSTRLRWLEDYRACVGCGWKGRAEAGEIGAQPISQVVRAGPDVAARR